MRQKAVMRNNQSSHHWISRFCAHLMQLQPGLSLQAAVNRAIAVYPYAGDLDPEYAATMSATKVIHPAH
jgi:hypothetical protein